MELLYLFMWLCLVTIELYYHLLGYKMYGTYFTKAKCPVSQLLLFYRQGIMNQCSRFKDCFFKCLLLNQICTCVGVQHREHTLFPKTSLHMATVGSFSSFYEDLTFVLHIHQMGFLSLACAHGIYCRKLCLVIHEAHADNCRDSPLNNHCQCCYHH